MEKKYLYGLDLSLSCTGVSVYDLEEKRFVYVGSISTEHIKKNKSNTGLYLNAIKLNEIYEFFVFLKVKYPPKEIAIERGYSRFNNATQVIFRVHGLINFMFKDIPQTYYPPKKIKSQIFKGTASKEDLERIIKLNYTNVNFENGDESDSFAVALTHLMENGVIKAFPQRAEPKGKK